MKGGTWKALMHINKEIAEEKAHERQGKPSTRYIFAKGILLVTFLSKLQLVCIRVLATM